MLPSPMGLVGLDVTIPSDLSHRTAIRLQPFRSRMRFKVSLVNILNEEDPAIDHLFEENILHQEHEQPQENILHQEHEQPQENIPRQEHEQPREDPTTGPTIDHVFEENIPRQEHEQPREDPTTGPTIDHVFEENIPRQEHEQPRENILHQEHEQPQENIPNYEGQQQRVGSSGLGQQQRVGGQWQRVGGQQQRVGSSGGNMDEIKKNIARKELNIKAEKEKLRGTNIGLCCLSKVAVLLNLLSSHVPLVQNPLSLQSAMDKNITRQFKELFGKSVADVAVADYLSSAYDVIRPLMSRLAPGYTFNVTADGTYFTAVGDHATNLNTLQNLLGELEELKLRKEELERKLQEEQGI